MKRTIIMLSIFLISVTLAFSQSLTVTSPSLGDNWERSSTYNITWTYRGSLDANVKIRLFNSSGSVKILDISNSTLTNSRRYRWTVPGSIRAGNYKIRIKTLDNRVSHDSYLFSIDPAVADDELTAVTTIKKEIPPITIRNTELSIINVSRADHSQLMAGNPLHLNVTVRNQGSWTANICIATPGDKNEKFYHKGECGIINGGTSKTYTISVPFMRTNIKGGHWKSTVFIVAANATGTLFKATWKDGNTSDNFRTFDYPLGLPDLVVTEIGPLRYSIFVRGQPGSEISIRVKNQGDVASSPGMIGIKEKGPHYGGTCGVEGYVLFYMPAIAPGETKTGRFKFPCPLMHAITESTGRNYWFEAFVNSTNTFAEFNLANNKKRVTGEKILPVLTSDPKTSTFEGSWR